MSPREKLLAILTLINLLNYHDRFILAAVLEPIADELSLSDEELGRLTLMFVVVYMLAAPVFGYLADSWNRPRLIAVGIALWTTATTSSAFAQSYNALLAARAFVGIGEAAYASLGPAVLSDLFSEAERPKAFTWFFMAIPVGSALGYAVGGFVAGLVGWRAAFLISATPGLLLALWMAQQNDPPRGMMDQKAPSAPSADVSKVDVEGAHGITPTNVLINTSLASKVSLILKNRVWLVCTLSATGYTFAMGALSTWGPTLLQRKFEVSITHAGLVFGGLAVVTGIVGTFVGGSLASYFAARNKPNAGLWVSGISLLAAAPVVALGLHISDLNTVYFFFFVGMVLLFANTSPLNTLIVSSLPASIRAMGTAMNVLVIHLFGDALSPVLVGSRADALGGSGDALSSALMMVVPAIVLAGIILWWARTRKEVRQLVE